MFAVDKIVSVPRDALQRFSRLPPWVLLGQLFLGIGWLRAGIAHGVSGTWWSGDELLAFVADRRPQALPIYGHFLDGIVGELPTGFAAVVLLTELAVGVALLANVRSLEALTVGCFLNLHFIAAGQVNPSIFYLIISLSVIGWSVEANLATERIRSLARTTTIVGSVAAVVLLPAVQTLAPASVIEDPASVLILLTMLVVAALWTSYLRRRRPSSADRVEPTPWWTDAEVVERIERDTGYAFTATRHQRVARRVGVLPPSADAARTLKRDYAIYVAEADRYLYSDAWVSALVAGLSTVEGFVRLVDERPEPCRRFPVGNEAVEIGGIDVGTATGESGSARRRRRVGAEEAECPPVDLALGERDTEVDRPGFEIVVRT